jgi:hypothetical protein
VDVPLLISLVPATAAVAAAFVTFREIVQKGRAEREYLRLLSAQATTLCSLRARLTRDRRVMTSEELQELIASLDCVAQGLSPEYQRLIAEGLHQRSVLGRARYVAKLMNKAGIGSGPFLLAIPVIANG